MRKGAMPAIGAACGIALAVMLVLALRQAPSHDEFYTLGHIQHARLADVVRSYRHTADATPPLQYVVSWATSRLTGTGLVWVRLPYIVGWVIATASIGLFLRRLHPAAILVGALVPTASALTALGMYARPYALMFGAVGVALVAWQRTVEHPHGWAATTALGVALGLAGAFDPVAAAAVVAFAIAEIAVRRTQPGRPRRVLVAIVASLVPVVASLAWLSRDIRVQSTQATSLSPLSLPAFYVSTARPAALLVLAVVGCVAWMVVRWRRDDGDRGERASWTQPRSETILGLALVLAVPPLVILGMWATSGFYLHRYVCPALFGGSILLAGATDAVARRSPRLPWLIVAAALASVPIAAARATLETPSHAQIQHQLEALRLPRPGTRVVFLFGYEYLLARADRPQSAGAWELESPSPEPGTQAAQVDLARLVDDTNAPVEVVGDPAGLRQVMGTQVWTVRIVARSGLHYDEIHRTMDSMLVRGQPRR